MQCCHKILLDMDCKNIVLGFKKMKFSLLNISRVFRNGNCLAHNLAKSVLTLLNRAHEKKKYLN